MLKTWNKKVYGKIGSNKQLERYKAKQYGINKTWRGVEQKWPKEVWNKQLQIWEKNNIDRHMKQIKVERWIWSNKYM